MTHRWISLAALPAFLLLAEPGLAADSPTAPFSVAPTLGALTVLAPVAPALPEASLLATWCGPTLESIRYRPRPRYRDRDRERDRERSWDRGSRSSGFSQIHAGFFDPNDDPPSSFLAGVRAGANMDERFQLGFGLDWNHRADRRTVVVAEGPIPGGGTARRETVLARSSANLFPIMAILQLSPGMDLPFSPYFGVGGGYELLFLSAEDFQTGSKFDATYGGWGWQLWGGASFPVSGRTRLAAEVFMNEAELERDVDDPTTGQTLREVVPQDGVGMRFGLSWGF